MYGAITKIPDETNADDDPLGERYVNSIPSRGTGIVSRGASMMALKQLKTVKKLGRCGAFVIAYRVGFESAGVSEAREAEHWGCCEVGDAEGSGEGEEVALPGAE